jgi:hypothetical protein
MENKIIEYLKENKDKYERDDLIAELKKTGYSDEEIAEGIKTVYEKRGAVEVLTPTSEGQPQLSRKVKIIEFCKGFFLFILISIVVSLMSLVLGPFSIISGIGLLIGGIIWIRRSFEAGRKYFAIGLIVALILPFLFVGGCFIVILNMSF